DPRHGPVRGAEGADLGAVLAPGPGHRRLHRQVAALLGGHRGVLGALGAVRAAPGAGLHGQHRPRPLPPAARPRRQDPLGTVGAACAAGALPALGGQLQLLRPGQPDPVLRRRRLVAGAVAGAVRLRHRLRLAPGIDGGLPPPLHGLQPGRAAVGGHGPRARSADGGAAARPALPRRADRPDARLAVPSGLRHRPAGRTGLPRARMNTGDGPGLTRLKAAARRSAQACGSRRRPAAAMTRTGLHPCFLGPYGENDQLLESLVVEFLRDHVYWRRNLHPEDLPAIPTGANREPGYVAFEARLRRELHLLSAALKRSVPFHSPRYLGHMVSDLLIPGLAAQVLALPYNPNNVSADAAPITIDLELKAGLQLAAMIGWPADPGNDDCAFGHLTSGGTLANVQGLRLALALKAFPVALRAASVALPGLPDLDWHAYNTGPEAGTALFSAWCAWRDALQPRERRAWQQRVEAQRIESLGLADFL